MLAKEQSWFRKHWPAAGPTPLPTGHRWNLAFPSPLPFWLGEPPPPKYWWNICWRPILGAYPFRYKKAAKHIDMMVKHRYSPLVIQGGCQIQDRKFPALTHRFPALTHRFPALVFFKNLYNQHSGPMSPVFLIHSCALNVHFVLYYIFRGHECAIYQFQGPWMCPLGAYYTCKLWHLQVSYKDPRHMNINHASISSHSGLMNEYVIQSGHLSPNLIFTFRAHELRRAIYL